FLRAPHLHKVAAMAAVGHFPEGRGTGGAGAHAFALFHLPRPNPSGDRLSERTNAAIPVSAVVDDRLGGRHASTDTASSRRSAQLCATAPARRPPRPPRRPLPLPGAPGHDRPGVQISVSDSWRSLPGV